MYDEIYVWLMVEKKKKQSNGSDSDRSHVFGQEYNRTAAKFSCM